jgi:hypothetical protein
MRTKTTNVVQVQVQVTARLELAHQPDHLILLLGRNFREHRQRHDPALIGERVGKLFGGRPKVRNSSANVLLVALTHRMPESVR